MKNIPLNPPSKGDLDRLRESGLGFSPRAAAVNLALLAAACLVSLGLIEAGLRWYEQRLIRTAAVPPSLEFVAPALKTAFSPRVERFVRPWDPDGSGLLHQKSGNRALVYELRPDVSLNDYIRTNPQGFRDAPFTEEKPEGVYRIVVVGDSVTFGWWEREEQTYAAQLERLLNEHAASDLRFEVYNMGVGGYNAAQECELIRSRVPAYAPDLILLQYCANDNLVGEDAGLWRHFSRSPFRTLDFFRLRWQRLRERFYEEDLVRRSYRRLAESAQGISLAVVLFPSAGAAPEKGQSLSTFSRDLGFLALDLGPAYSAFSDGLLMADTHHPNAFGHEIAAEEILHFLQETATIPTAASGIPRFESGRRLFSRGFEQYLSGNLDPALSAWKEAAQAESAYGPLAGDVLYNGAYRHLCAGKSQEGLHLVEEAMVLDTGRGDYRLLHGVLLAMEGRHGAAFAKIEAEMGQAPAGVVSFAEDLVRISLDLYFNGEGTKAQNLLEAATKLRPDLCDVTGGLGDVFEERITGMPALWFETGRLPAPPAEECWTPEARRALASADEAIRRWPFHFNAYRMRFELLQRHIPALAHAQAWLELTERYPLYASAPFYLGLTREGGGDVQGAIKAYRIALDRKPTDAYAHLMLGALLLGNGQRESGRESLEKAAKLDASLGTRVEGVLTRYSKKPRP